MTLNQAYYVGRHEVTQGQWEAVMGAPMSTACGSFGIGPELPVYCVTWQEVAGAGGFVERLNTHLGSSAYRLPTEAEWERAARAESDQRFSAGDLLVCGDECEPCVEQDAFMWWCGSDPFTTSAHPVATRAANGYGLYDMHGNLWEWVQDWFEWSLGTSPATDPTGPPSGDLRVVRGGAWNQYARYARSAARANGGPLVGFLNVGFRLAKTAD